MLSRVEIREKNTASQLATVKTGACIRFKGADDPASDNNNPLIKPSVGSNRSYEKWLRLYISSPGPNVSITNPKFYTSGANPFGTGVSLYIRTTNPGSFSTPAVPANDSAGTSAFTYTSASPKALDVANTGPFSGSLTDIADYIVLWMTIGTTVIPSKDPTGRALFTFSYDET